MRKLIIVSPHFPPVNAADHQRVRMALPYFGEFDWKPTVLAVGPDAVEGSPIDLLLTETVPADVEVIRTAALPASATRAAGVGSLALRSLPFLQRAGDKLLAQSRKAKGESRRLGAESGEAEGFDLVFFSTTQFPVMSLGPRWKKKFGVPYAVDMQDPWFDDYYERTQTPPPGGKLKYDITRFIARRLEPKVMRDVSHVISVSPSYVETLRKRYPYLQSEDCTVLPFGAPEKDFELLACLDVRQTIFDASDGKQHWVYVGRGGDDMAGGLRLLFSAIRDLRQSASKEWQNVRLHFAGTSYAPAGRGSKTIEPIAREFGLGEIVHEITDRQPYFETLKALNDADALLVTGSDSPSYSASKLYPYMLARKPLLAILHEQSPAVKILRGCNGAEVVTFDPANLEASGPAMRSVIERLLHLPNNQQPITNNSGPAWPIATPESLGPYTAREMSRKMCSVFDRVVMSPR